MASKHAQVMLAIKAKILSLNLDSIAPANVKVIRLNAWDKAIKAGKIKLPGILISPYGTETINQQFTGTNAQDDYGWPTAVCIVQQGDFADMTNELEENDRFSVWRETLLKAFHDQHLAGVTGDITSKVTPAPIQELTAWIESHMFVSGITVRTYTRELVR